MIIAIDGPAASGKSTVARALALRLGLVFLDTGAMYRAVTLAVQARGLDPRDGSACGQLAQELELDFDAEGHIRIEGRAGEPAIRSAAVTRDVSHVAAHPEVRRALVPRQRAIAGRAVRGVVAEGRDTTTVVFPEADHKFFLTASSKERARRRALEVGQLDDAPRFQREIEERDALDRERADSPLRRAADAALIETDGQSAAEIVEQLAQLVGAREASGQGRA